MGSLLLVAAIAAGASYMVSWGLALPPTAATAWKGAGVALLAAYAATRARSLDGWLLVAVMALGAAGDVALEVIGLTKGAVAFLAGHLVAIWLYARNRRRPISGWDRAFALAIGFLTIVGAIDLAFGSVGPGVAIYAAALAVMAMQAWLSRFPRERVGLGALMFAASDLLIFGRAGVLHGAGPWIGDAIWILYFGGQTLICVGVADGLELGPTRSESRAARA